MGLFTCNLYLNLGVKYIYLLGLQKEWIVPLVLFDLYLVLVKAGDQYLVLGVCT